MECCLLCFDINKEFVECIKVDSTQWQELNIKNIIEKHLFIIESFLPSSWLCQTCWQELFDFHKFYLRIKEAHTDFSKLMKGESKDHKENLTRDENKSHDEFIDLFESHLEPEIDQLAVEDYKPTIIKEELDEDPFDNNIPPNQRNKRSRTSKNVASYIETIIPLTNLKEIKSPRSKNKKKELRSQSNFPIETICENSELANMQMKQDPDTIPIPDTPKKSLNSSDSDDIDFYTYYDYKSEKNTKRPNKATKKKIPRKIKSEKTITDLGTKRSKRTTERNISNNINSNSDDSNTDFDYKSKENDIKRPKLTSKQKDTFLTENFKMCCVLCQIPMTNFCSLVKHFETEHKERGYAVCCNKKFYHRVRLLEHVHRHVDPNNFKCNLCEKILSSLSSLQSHQLIHLSEEEKKFPCTECGKSFAEQSFLSHHIKSVHLKKYLKICDICGKSLRGDIFERHMLEHEGKKIPPVNCEICGFPFSDKKNLKRHMVMQHPVGGKQSHNCHICSKISPNIGALREHIRRVHNMGNNHKCTMCGRGFKWELALKEHMATHTGIALYTCPWCPKTFNANSSMYVHRKKQHPIEWEEDQRQKKPL